MEKNGKKHIGFIYTIAIFLLSFIIIFRIISLITDKKDNEIIYLDPILSTTLVRGTIYDRNKNIIAIEAPKYGFLIKDIAENPAYAASIIAPYISISNIEAEEIIRRGTGFIELKNIPSISEVNTLEKLLKVLDLDSIIELETIEERVYNTQGNFALLIGSVDESMNGISGFERYANQSLSPKPGLGYYIIYGSNITTTIDLRLQKQLEEAVLNNGDAETAMILSQSGEILSYYGKGSDDIYKNMILSLSNNGSSITYSPSFLSSAIKDESIPADNDHTFYFYISGCNEKEALISSLRNILVKEGKIKEQNY